MRNLATVLFSNSHGGATHICGPKKFNSSSGDPQEWVVRKQLRRISRLIEPARSNDCA